MDFNRFERKNKFEVLGFITLFILILYKGLSLKFYLLPLVNVPFTFNYTYFKILSLFIFIAIISSSLYYCSSNISRKNKSLQYIGGSTIINVGILIVSVVLSFVGTNIFINYKDIAQNALSNYLLVQRLDSIIIPFESLWITFVISLIAIQEYKKSFILVSSNLLTGIGTYIAFTLTNVFVGDFSFYGPLLAILLAATLSNLIALFMIYNKFKNSSQSIIKIPPRVYLNIFKTSKWSILSSFLITAIIFLFINAIVTNDIHQEILSLYTILSYIFLLVILSPIYALSLTLGISLNNKYKSIDFKTIRRTLTKFVCGIILYLFVAIFAFRVLAPTILSNFNLDINSEVLTQYFTRIFIVVSVCSVTLGLSTPIKGLFLGIGKLKRLFISKAFLTLITVIPVVTLQYLNIFRFNGDSVFIYISIYLIVDLLISFVSYSKVMNSLEISEITIMFKKYNASSKNPSVG